MGRRKRNGTERAEVEKLDTTFEREHSEEKGCTEEIEEESEKTGYCIRKGNRAKSKAAVRKVRRKPARGRT